MKKSKQSGRTESKLLELEENLAARSENGMSYDDYQDALWLIDILSRMEKIESDDKVFRNIELSPHKLGLTRFCRNIITDILSLAKGHGNDFVKMCQTYRQELTEVEPKNEIQHFIINGLDVNNIFYRLHAYLQADGSNADSKSDRKFDDFISLLDLKTSRPFMGHDEKSVKQYRLSVELICAKYKSRKELTPAFFVGKEQKPSTGSGKFSGRFAELMRELINKNDKNPTDLIKERFEYEAILEKLCPVSTFAEKIQRTLTKEVTATPRPGQ